jgi:hypothetical protein
LAWRAAHDRPRVQDCSDDREGWRSCNALDTERRRPAWVNSRTRSGTRGLTNCTLPQTRDAARTSRTALAESSSGRKSVLLVLKFLPAFSTGACSLTQRTTELSCARSLAVVATNKATLVGSHLVPNVAAPEHQKARGNRNLAATVDGPILEHPSASQPGPYAGPRHELASGKPTALATTQTARPRARRAPFSLSSQLGRSRLAVRTTATSDSATHANRHSHSCAPRQTPLQEQVNLHLPWPAK